MPTPSHPFTRYALLACAVIAPAPALAQASAATDSTSCFAQPRAQRDTAAREQRARDTASAAGARAGSGGGRAGADIILLASVSARELRFNSVPRVSVRLCGGLDSVRVVERRNLPERVVPGVTYRDVYVAVEILGHIYADCVRETIAGARPSSCPAGADTARPPRRPR